MQNYSTLQRKQLNMFFESNPDKSFCVKQIYNALKEYKISMSAVYRNIASMETEGLITRHTKKGQREIYYQYVSLKLCKDKIHLICEKCGKTFHVSDNISGKMYKDILKKDGFKLDKSKTVLYGLCNSCQNI